MKKFNFKIIIILIILMLSSSISEAENYRYEKTGRNSLRIFYSLEQGETAENIYIKYGFNGWNRIKKYDEYEEYTDKYDCYQKVFYIVEKMKKLQENKFSYTIEFDDETSLVNFSFLKKFQLKNKDFPDNEYRISLQFPYMGPWLSWNNDTDPLTGIVINLRTEKPALVKIRYKCRKDKIETTIAENIPLEFHHFKLDNLYPDMEYEYRIVDNHGNESEKYVFRTPDEKRDLKIIILGDIQDNGNDRRFSEIADILEKKHKDADLMMICGDLVWDNLEKHWWTFFHKGRKILSRFPVMTVPGNHDKEYYLEKRINDMLKKGKNVFKNIPNIFGKKILSEKKTDKLRDYKKYSDLPGNEEYYSFKLKNNTFICLNTEKYEEFKPDGKQYCFIRDTLKNKSTHWNFIFMHKPPLNAGWRHYKDQFKLNSIFEVSAQKIDWIFSGHEHLYQRFKPYDLQERKTVSEYGKSGAGIIVVPPGGNYPESRIIELKNDKIDARKKLAFPDLEKKIFSHIGYVILETSMRKISIKTYGIGNLEIKNKVPELIDSVEYLK